jgi:hypothetical protein
VLSGVAQADVRILGEGSLGRERMYAVQIVSILDVVDLESSIIQNYGPYQVVGFPAFHRDAEGEIESHIFKIPESPFDIFLGKVVKDSLDRAGVRGLRCAPVPFADDEAFW